VRRYGRVVLGGTFDRLHLGHEALLGAAFAAGRTVAIGVTTDRFLAEHPKPSGARIRSYAARRRALRWWLRARYPRRRWTLVPLRDRFGRSVEDGVDALVVSAETLDGGRAVNAERRRRGRHAVPVLAVPLVLGDDLRPISSRRIRSGEIDRWGRRGGPIRVAVAVEDPRDRAPTVAGIRAAFPRARVVGVPIRGSASSASRRPAALRRVGDRADLLVAVARDSARTRSVTVRAGENLIEAHAVPRTSSSAFARALGGLLNPSARAKRYRPGRR
jgi:pantetheine-phosphate adenylyltransferase